MTHPPDDTLDRPPRHAWRLPRRTPPWLLLALAPGGLHAVGTPEPDGDPLDVADPGAWQSQAAAVLAGLAPDGLGGRAVRLMVDDRLTLPGVLSGRLWPLSRRELQDAARDWFAQQGSAADWRVHAVLQPDGRHALVCAMREAVLQAVGDAVEMAGGRLAHAVPRWGRALAGAEAATARGRALVAAPRAGADHAVVGVREAGSWIRVELEPVDASAGWPDTAEALQRRQDASPAAGPPAATAGRAPWAPLRRVVSGGDAASAERPGDWLAVAPWPEDELAPTAWSAGSLDLVAPLDPRGGWLGTTALAVGALALAAAATGLQADWRRLEGARLAATTAAADLPVARAAVRPVPVSDDTVAGVRAELARNWVPVLDRLADRRPADVLLQRVEPAGVTGAADSRVRVSLAGQAPSTAVVLDWKRTLEADDRLQDVRLVGWQREGDGTRVAFRMEVVGVADR